MEYSHIPVMLDEVIEYLNPQPGEKYIDCTLGGAGYTLKIAKMVGGKGKVLAIDLDPMAIDNAKAIIEKQKLKNIILANENFSNILQIVEKYFEGEQAGQFAGIVFDLGLSSAQLEDRSRGFSFKLGDAPLSMAFAGSQRLNAEYILNNYPEAELKNIIRDFGEEKFAYSIAKKIIAARSEKNIKTTGKLVEIINSAVPEKYKKGKIHPATRTFQALRIAVNGELDNIRTALSQTADILKSGGRVAVVSYHSLEDRIVKQFFKAEARGCICPPSYPTCVCGHKAKFKIITKKYIGPSEEEVGNNPRARSAKLRVGEKI